MNFKKTLLPLILAIGLSLSYGCANQQTNSKWSKLQNNQPNSLAKIQKYLYEEICYSDEKTEKWNSPKKTIELEYGDCEEIAILGSYFAEKLKYPPKTLFLIDKIKGAHLTTLLEEKNSGKIKYGAIEKTDLFYPTYDSIDSLIYDINRFYNKNYSYYAVLDSNSLNKNWRTTNRNLISSSKLQTLNLTPVKQPTNQENLNIKGYKVGSIILRLPK